MSNAIELTDEANEEMGVCFEAEEETEEEAVEGFHDLVEETGDDDFDSMREIDFEQVEAGITPSFKVRCACGVFDLDEVYITARSGEIITFRCPCCNEIQTTQLLRVE